LSEAQAIPVTVRAAVFADVGELAARARQHRELAEVAAFERAPDSPLNARLRVADEEAKRIVDDASAEAARIIETARAGAAAVREDAHQEGYRAGFSEGYSAGHAAADDEAARAHERTRSEIAGMVAQIEEERRAIWLESEQQIVSFSLEIAQKVVKDDAKVNRDIAISVIRNALRRVVDTTRIRIRVSVDDLANVRSEREMLISLIDGLDNVEIVEDRRVSPGGRVIETNGGTIDERGETQFAELSTGLDELVAEAA
jgi:flagellar assembly protein FliH